MKLLLTPPFDHPTPPKVLGLARLARIFRNYDIAVVRDPSRADFELTGRAPFEMFPQPQMPMNRVVVIDGEPPQPEFTLPHYTNKRYAAVVTPATGLYDLDGMAFYIPPMHRRPPLRSTKWLCQLATYRSRPGNDDHGTRWLGTTSGVAWSFRVLCNLRVKVGMALQRARPSQVDLYGRGWPVPVAGDTRNAATFETLCEGRDKIVRDYAFDLTWENMEIPGYVSEKFWSSIRQGVLPVYWGPPEFHAALPTGTIVDARKWWNGQNYDVRGLLDELDGIDLAQYRQRREKLLDWYETLPRDSAEQSAEKSTRTLAKKLCSLQP